MTQPVAEPSDSRTLGGLEYRTRQLARRPALTSPGALTYQIKVFRDTVPSVVGDDAFVWVIPPWFDGCEIIGVAASYSVEGGGSDTQIAIRLSAPCETGADILSSKIVIDAAECNDDGTAVVIPSTIVAAGEHLHIDIDQASGGLGLNVAVVMIAAGAAGVSVVGQQGPPGGATNFTGAFPGGPGASGTPGGAGSQWTTSTSYEIGDTVVNNNTYYVATADHTSGASTEPGVGASWQTVWTELTYNEGDVVSNNGTTYVALVDHTATTANEPGVGVDWEDFWMPLVEGHQPYSGITVMILGNGYELDVGVKAAIPIPFDCEIIEATLLADAAGDVVVDLRKDTYGAYPPTPADSITGASPLTLVGANKTTDVVLTGWDTTLTVGDVLLVAITSTDNLAWLSISLRVQRP
jgi:hypothetical protein